MIRSMTGYSRAESVVDGINVLVELKTVNSKYLNLDVNSGETFAELELDVSRYIKERLKRGTVKARVEISLIEDSGLLKPDFGTATSIYASLKAIADRLGLGGEVSIDSMTRFKEILRSRPSEELARRVWNAVVPVLEKALESLNRDREREGLNLLKALEDYLDKLQQISSQLKEMSDGMVDYYREFLKKRVEKLFDGELDENRLEQEVVLLAEKADISEELVRLDSHIASFRETLSNDGDCGVQLDFICQELHRELSTVASKSKKLEISALSVEGRTLVNKLREQVQNIE
ncbi:MAG TPA: YicC family protein [Mesotoga sp.]|nr:YicC family protein [Mesotoga sp.]NLX33674.1 YicC family protein [Thermotogaceae bacterium]MDD4040579.1 YicC family protein [Mesotoga sp.]MDD4478085.1 YicC family protein [Mesotoga sp.]MDD5744115.1 YicC family protein [Mesotoga sp.]